MQEHFNTPDTLFESALELYGNSSDKKLLLACSGGIDSMVLFDLLLKSKRPFFVAHVNFKLRGEASDRDEAFVEEICRANQITCFTKCFDTKAESSRLGLSVQMTARVLRYQWFNELYAEYPIQAVLTAHHADDQIETALINMIRGTGIDGLAGMQPFNGIILRPLLQIDRSIIKSYAEKHQLAWREDVSNQETLYQRNAIRHLIIPELTKLNPSFSKVMLRNMQIWSEQSQLLNTYSDNWLKKIVVKTPEMQSVPINRIKPHKQKLTLLYHWLNRYQFQFEQVEQLIQAIDTTHETKLFNSLTHRLIKTNRDLILQSIKNTTDDIIILKGSGSYRFSHYKLVLDTIDNSIEINFNNVHYQYINADMLHYPLHIRMFKKGDYFYPYGLNKKKKLSDYYNDHKFTLIEKEQTPLLCMNDKILSLLGHTIDHRFRVQKTTRNVLRILIKKDL